MGQKLVIVESPSKAKTISRYLGKNYIVEASMGHVRDLPKSQLGVDTENNYTPKYITIRGKGDLIKNLRKKAKKSDKVYLATDPDREGEAISWHLSKILDLKEDDECRIEFNEITKNAIKTAIKKPRKIDINLVDAQQARRILDRLVGYEISPILWKKVRYGLSAGRVQSVALKMICEREREILDFKPKEFWIIECDLLPSKGKKQFTVKLTSYKNKKLEINNEAECKKIVSELNKGKFIVKGVKETLKKKNPLPPFTTSTLQQDAYRKINFSTKKTMSVAQQLYEGVEVKGHGTIGLITYMRTDSVRIATVAQDAARTFILNNYGEEYLPQSARNYKGKKNIQDAHEAIRPTYIDITPDMLKESLKPDLYKLYSLIWKRFIACQMEASVINSKTLEVINNDYTLKASGYNVKFDGFMKLYEYNTEDDDVQSEFPKLEKDQELINKSIQDSQHFTQPPARFSEASLVKTLEENGIGRPSTYAPIISTLLDRKYVLRSKKTLEPTELGFVVNDILCNYFSNIIDMDFTVDMEEKLDKVEEGDEKWNRIVDELYHPLMDSVNVAEKELEKIKIEDKESDVVCDKCGRKMVIKHGRFGDFLACPGYPECKNTKAIVEELNVPCPKCGGKILVKKSKKGRKFYGCSNYNSNPKCDFVSWFEPIDKKCPYCNSYVVKKFSKTKGTYLECANSECKKILNDNDLK